MTEKLSAIELLDYLEGVAKSWLKNDSLEALDKLSVFGLITANIPKVRTAITDLKANMREQEKIISRLKDWLSSIVPGYEICSTKRHFLEIANLERDDWREFTCKDCGEPVSYLNENIPILCSSKRIEGCGIGWCREKGCVVSYNTPACPDFEIRNIPKEKETND